MARRRRPTAAGLIFHVVNRGAKRALLFETAAEFEDFEGLLQEALTRFNVALFTYCVMSNHFHFSMSPRVDGALSSCMHWLTTTHARRWQRRRDAEGLGAVYQSRFSSIPVQDDRHFVWVCRYIERNPLRARLVNVAEDWRWSSLWQRCYGDPSWLAPWPTERPADWITLVNTPQTEQELAAFRTAVRLGRPFGSEQWQQSLVDAGHISKRAIRGRPKRTNCPLKMTSDPNYT
jgi:putative transposase